MNSSIDRYFDGKPEALRIFRAIEAQVSAFGPSRIEVASQIAFGVKRKFAWIWLYNVTQKNPNGILHLMLAVDEKIDDPHVRNFNQVSANRWNHQIIVRTLEDAQSDWLRLLIERAYRFGSGQSS
jgi:Domain of unknown function (DUF5655)